MRSRALGLVSCAVTALSVSAGSALADNWSMNVTADNFYRVYFGTPTQTTFVAGGGAWPAVSNLTALNRPSTDYLYVQTHSDQFTGQGFLGTFTNTTTATTVSTDTTNWQVFPAGAYLAQLGYTITSWPAFQQPTQAEVDAAILYATTNNLWIAPSTFPGATNLTGTSLWGPIGAISPSAQWIWHNANASANPLMPGFNHDEFLVFRYRGAVPAPAGLGLLAAAGVVGGRRRRR